MVGFKSFAEKMGVELERGLTAIVGPNGCGKSNVADALRWVFGEQNPRLLRGAQMEDVIFNGTDQRKAVGRAEVSATFVEAEGVLPLGYHEVTITRRLFRSGESQYLINQNPCLLRDVRELFMGTGIGTNAYFLLEQGKIDLVLSAKPEDRRAVFEEAAGIMKYKVKKVASLHRLESTDANLLRLADIIREVKRQIISLERQAGKARRYQEAREELKALELKVARLEFEERSLELKNLEVEMGERTFLRDEFQKEVEALQGKIQEIEKNHKSTFEELAQLEKRDAELFHKFQNAGSEIELLKERILEIDFRMVSDQEEVVRSQERVASLRSELDQEEKGRQAFMESHRDRKEDLEGRKTRLEFIIKKFEESQEKLNLLKAQFLDLKEKEAQLNNQRMVHHHREKDWVLREEKLETEREKVMLHIQEKEHEKSQCQQLKDSLSCDVKQIEERLKILLGEKIFFEGEMKEISEEIEKEKGEFLKCTAKREVAWQLGALQEESQSSVAGKEISLQGILKIPREMRKAFQTVLGRKWMCILKETRTRIEKIHQTVFFPLDTVVASPEAFDLSGLDGFIGYAKDWVQCSSEYQNAVASILGDLVILKTSRSFQAIPVESLGRFRFVTLDGDLLDRDGTWNFNGISDETVVDLQALDADIEAISGRLRALEKKREPLQEKGNRLDREISTERDQLRLKELEWANVSGHFERLLSKLKDLQEEESGISNEEKDLMQEVNDLEKMVSQISDRLKHLTLEINLLAEGIAHQDQTVTALENEKEVALSELAEVKVMSRSIEEEEARFAQRIHELETGLEELGRLIEKRNLDLNAAHAKKTEMGAKIELLSKNLESFSQEKVSLGVRRDEVSKRVGKMTETIRQNQEILSGNVARLDEMRESLSHLEVKKAQATLQCENLVQRMKEKYDVSLSEFPLESEALPMEEVHQRILELQEKLRQMGEVNLVAIQEFDEHRARYEFLLKQQEDLMHAKDDLVKAIQKINVTIRELFVGTFEKIRDTFNEIYRRLFGGGRAVVELLEDGDVLECGINISAQPPGKKLQAISLLSGGEKTLTAVSLLLAIFKVRPSPFCFMDEMDAALDESNIMRFLSLLDEFKSQTQFILITHNKRTISVADVIYGVTMEDSGISKIVSIRLPKEEAKSEAVVAG
ncbi:MAG: chromosome segregation protein SMC [Chlamydiae bacterium]|nr:chromosome segregation protein SMC [Chlamydiota bacterium]MBI3266152.1 chromosome segregation protein SMC [Chlamydiota bacterium]